MNKKVYITLLSTENYLKGVLVLNKSLKKTKARYPLFVLVSPGISEKTVSILSSFEIETIRMTESVALDYGQHNQSAAYSHWNNTFDKLYLFNLTQFEKLVYIDSDMLVLENIDELFEREHMSAVSAGSKYPGNEAWIGNLNSGILVIRPDKKNYAELTALIPVVAALNVEKFGDQDIIKEYIKGRWTEDLWLDHKYNMFNVFLNWHIKNENYKIKYFSLNPFSKNKTNVKIIHFIELPKPWMREIGRMEAFKMHLKTLIYALMGREIGERIVKGIYISYLREFSKL